MLAQLTPQCKKKIIISQLCNCKIVAKSGPLAPSRLIDYRLLQRSG